MTNPDPIKVLVIDDSALTCKVIAQILDKDPAINVVGTAESAQDAKLKIQALKPNVITLDIVMPKVDGLSFLKTLMQEDPLPVIIMSSLTTMGSPLSLQAIESGAVDVMSKPNEHAHLDVIGPQIILKVKAAAAAKSKISKAGTPSSKASKTRLALTGKPAANQLILLGASTGGTEALKDILSTLPADIPGTCIVQHMPEHFSNVFANRLNDLCAFDVKEAEEGDAMRPGLALVAPGNYHILLKQEGQHYYVSLDKGPPVWFQRPSVDILFKSASKIAGNNILAGILTGMGKDGAEGLLALKNKGAVTFAQDEESSIVFGMSKAAYDIGATDKLIPLDRCALHIVNSLSRLGLSATH